ncbi:hypothetical protein [Chryseobacterium indologenes]|uniref:Uncharacterized protein n=1 Tax=Chryseobacterium indologenes TaxID=253 RepID=A0A0N0ZRX5_CHRID|nr:hypothetical protein [Chryseobacterium indologenes]KPE48970.1 hypothetical protein AOB46_22540 [Chryseobacterium indologenes]
MKIKEAYYYLFYKLYKWYESGPFVWYSDWKAGISIIALEIWTCVSIYSYLSIFLNRKISLSITEPSGFIPYIIILSTNLYFFSSSHKWKLYFEEFEKWPKRKNLISGIIVWSIIALIIFNFIFSINLMKSLLD